MADMVIFCGQSNMQGQSEKPPEDISIVAGAVEYRFLDDTVVPLKHPVGEDIDHAGNFFDKSAYSDFFERLKNAALFAPVDKNANMVPEFCKSYTTVAKREIIAVHAAKGSTEIDYWQKGAQGYEMMSRKVFAAIKKTEPEKIFFVWLQGESDAINRTTKVEYKQKIKMLNNDLKKDFNIEKFGIILVGRFTMDERDFEIINAQKEICNENRDFLMLTTITEKIVDDERYMNPNVSGHYNCRGQELIGRLAGEALGKYVTDKKETETRLCQE